MKFIRLFLHSTVLLGLFSCSKPAEKERKVVLSTTTFVGDLVSNLVEGEFETKVLMGPGVDPHLYRAKPSDIRQLKQAKIVFYSGLGLEGKLADVLKAQRGSKIQVRAVSDRVPRESLLRDENVKADHFDPHIWFDPKLWVTCIDVVAEELGKALPASQKTFAERALRLKVRYLKLDAWARREIEKIPKKQRVLISSHDAFAYFGRAFGLEVHGIQGISTASEAGLRDVLETIDLIKRRTIPAVFMESSVAPTLMKRISSDAEVKIGGTLYSDATGPVNPDAKSDAENPASYEGAFRSNVMQIVKGLSGKDAEP